MSWLINSSIGRKLIMSISGLFLVLFLMFHSLMNFVVIISADAYNTIAATLGANWYALIATGILALGFIFHIIYALILSLQNLKARGASRYAVSDSQKNVSWASKNMLVLGIIVLGFLALHLIHFWSKMQLVELMHGHNYAAAGYHDPTDGAYFIRELFTQPLYSSIYIVWLVALWYHLTHGFWSAMQTLGLNNKTWLPRIKKISYVLATIICLLFISVPVYYLLGFGA
ncbi:MULTISPECIES: succinate dehydrogenase cytochrome b subunit [Petrimonas]|jgi:succinate dehydrogenase / fumarate reductase cytochrome b subunit|uniref:Succinate dehydrogenase subunit C n=1 Tax=Petrimonas mucosa TaxID=1642646 RepID=A0A1G4GB91_9BACT|nr:MULTISPECIES: succinate dehydrogenase cytochrome b subunit [Petrimonas]MDD3561114.1 succinate dehydrogenase cytochrome b subunit [Petrimonas mucosa]SCM59823.1 Succinate dehydrogenase subunit C {ECO:0000313/EMBL:ADQ81109,1} [Petrimonas mucosa]SFU60961.1 succinate dehydrogenase subunit C [Porphyromonadaceae bacterium KHP3R9]HHT28785.1 succinate dehydrogenase cytochrome b subunit [Petrimonas mucosa]